MKKEIIVKLTNSFEAAAHSEQGVEYWMARDIQEILEYDKWGNFLGVIEKAKIACQNASQCVEDHFADTGKMVKIGSGSEREVLDIMLSRYACYLIAQNGDSRKESIAFAQSYFALQTITIKAKDFAGEITHFNVKRENLIGEGQIAEEHVKNNQDIRKVLAKSKIFPESLPPEEDIKKLEKFINKETGKLPDISKPLPRVSK